MSWQDQLKGDSLSWLLETETPEVRYLALRDLLERPKTDSELRAACKAAHKKGPIATILAEMDKTGYWVEPGPGYNPKYRSTVWSVILLAQLGASVEEDKRIAQACDLSFGSCPHRRRSVHHLGRTLWHCRLFAGKSLVGLAGTWL